MILNSRQLIGLRVRTQGGRFLGRVSGFEFDVLSGMIVCFEVSPSRLVKKIFAGVLSISRDQVVTIGSKGMVVFDSVVSVGEAEERPASA